ncbi:uncharacterized protein LOC134762421 [Penaeus indicus]|uniref:uncharacterized protein LOC134762421 n=1 Tax=Penaeus indicus TaxID=29960 RepID=UPI00300C9844
MFKRYPKYAQGQELATKFWWSITQLATTAVHDTFILVYSSLPKTKNGNVSVSNYFENAKKEYVLQELQDGGYDIDNFKVTPKKAAFYDLQVIRKILDHVEAKQEHREHLNAFKNWVRKLVHVRNVMSHHKLRSMAITQLMEDLEEVKDVLWELYTLAAELSGRAEADIVEAFDLLQQELDSLVSPATTCPRCSKEQKMKGNKDECGMMKESGQNKGYGKIIENEHKKSCRTVKENERKENRKTIENEAGKENGMEVKIERDTNDSGGIINLRTNDGNGKTSLHIHHMITTQEEGKEDARDRNSSSEEEILSSSEVASSSSSLEDSESDVSLQNQKETRGISAEEADESYGSDGGKARDENSREKSSADALLHESWSKSSPQSRKNTSRIFPTEIDQSNKNCSNISDGGIVRPSDGREPTLIPIQQIMVTLYVNGRIDTSSSSEEVPSSGKPACSNSFHGVSQTDSSQQGERDIPGVSDVETAGACYNYNSENGETRDNSRIGTSSSSEEVPTAACSNSFHRDSLTDSSQQGERDIPGIYVVETAGACYSYNSESCETRNKSSSSEEVPTSEKAACSNSFHVVSQTDSSQQGERDILGITGVETVGDCDSCSSESGETRDSSSSGDVVHSLLQVKNTELLNKDFDEAETFRENKENGPDTSRTDIQTDDRYSNEVNHVVTQNVNVDCLSTWHLNSTEYFKEKASSYESAYFKNPIKYFLILSLFSRFGLFLIWGLCKVTAVLFVLVYTGFQILLLLVVSVVVILRHLHNVISVPSGISSL